MRPGYVDYSCDRCGSVITDIIAHNRHHRALEQLRDGILAVTKIIVPDLPPGTLLEYRPDLPIKIVKRGEDDG